MPKIVQKKICGIWCFDGFVAEKGTKLHPPRIRYNQDKKWAVLKP